jgi:spore germination protein YaaH
MTLRSLGAAVLLCLAGASARAYAQPATMAYYESGGSAGALTREASRLQIVAADLFAVDASGQVTGRIPAILRRTAAAYHLRVLATISNFGAHGFNAAIAHAILSPGAAQDRALSGMLGAARGSAGVNLDFESVRRSDRDAYTHFARKLAALMHSNGMIAVLSVPAETKDDPRNSWTGAYDFAALGQSADLLQVMTYDENGPWGAPGPVAGLDWVTACLGFAKSVVPSAKITMGVPAYGYDWNLSASGGAQIAYRAVPALLRHSGATPQWDRPAASPWFSYQAADGSAHVVWYEDARSIRLKAALFARSGVSGASMYALGMDDAGFWSALQSGF